MTDYPIHHRYGDDDQDKRAPGTATDDATRRSHMPFEHAFHLEIHGLEEFAKFVAIIRGEKLDDEQLRALTARLAQSTDALSKAEQAIAPHS